MASVKIYYPKRPTNRSGNLLKKSEKTNFLIIYYRLRRPTLNFVIGKYGRNLALLLECDKVKVNALLSDCHICTYPVSTLAENLRIRKTSAICDLVYTFKTRTIATIRAFALFSCITFRRQSSPIKIYTATTMSPVQDTPAISPAEKAPAIIVRPYL